MVRKYIRELKSVCESGKVRSDVLRVLGIKHTFFKPMWRAFVASLHNKLATRMSNFEEGAFPSLDLTGSSSSQVAECWRQWKRSYQY